MSDDAERARLGELATALAEAAMGKRRLPVVPPRDAAALVGVMHAQLDEAIERRAVAAAKEGQHIACARGCAECCVSAVVASEDEVVAVVEWLRRPGNAMVRAAFEHAYARWRAALGPIVDEATEARTEEDRGRIGRAVKERRAMCAFNQDGSCTIYPVRPSLCRTTHALGSSAKCSGGDVDYYVHAETEETYAKHGPLHSAMHHALRPGKRAELLCKAVMRRLAGEVGRNEPCPCGSGTKFKKCCGA